MPVKSHPVKRCISRCCRFAASLHLVFNSPLRMNYVYGGLHRGRTALKSARVKRFFWIGGLFLTVYTFIYTFWFTPLPVYALDYLNLRPFFLPNILCDHCNNFTFRFIVENRNFCRSSTGGGPEDVFLLILVATYHPNLDGRQAIRKSWGNMTDYRGQRIKTLFMFGHHDDKNYNYQVRYELENYGDVIQADFDDNYRSLSNKTLMGLTWMKQYCPQARFVLKTDDDAFNVPQRYVDYLLNVVDVPKFVGGYCFTVMPDRRDGSKFYTPYTMYPERYYPTYCSGPGYVLSRDAVGDIIRVAPNVIYVTMEDVFVSGLCRVAAGIIYTQIPGVAEDQTRMTRCNLATWVKNGHNIYPLAVPSIWERVVTADRRKDCLGRDTALYLTLAIAAGLWCIFLYRMFT